MNKKPRIVKTAAKKSPMPDRNNNYPVASMTQPPGSVASATLHQQREAIAQARMRGYVDDLVPSSEEQIIQLVESMSNEEKVLLIQEAMFGLGMVSNMKTMYHALSSVIKLLPYFDSLLQRADEVSETVSLLNDLLKHRDEIEKLASATPGLQKILGNFAKLIPEQS